MYSGRSDPYWFLTPKEEAKFYELLFALDCTSAKINCPVLGYRGIEAVSEKETITLFNGIIEMVSGIKKKGFFDYDRNLEKWVYGTAKGKIAEELRDEIF